jgi:phosphoserine phosphatase RsbU/P
MARYKLIIAEDNGTLRRLLEYRLGKHFDVRIASNGEDALRLVQEEIPDLIVSDIMMPHMDGFALFDMLRRDDRTRAIPFIFLTAKTDDVTRYKGLGNGVDDYITKPFDIDFLLTRISKILERRDLYQSKLNARIGRDFSDRLMPKSLPKVSGYRTHFYSQPKEDGGGDLFDWVEVRPGVFLMTIADIMGKGLQAKFYAFSFLSYIRSTVHALAEQDDSPAALLTKVNRVLAKDEVLEETFASMLIIRWEAETGTLTYANAGHCRPILVTPHRAGIVEHSEMILGLDPEEIYTDRSFRLPPGAAIVAYTDGLVEQMAANGEHFGERGLANIASEASRSDQPVHSMLRILLERSAEPYFGDDVLVLWVQRLASEETPVPATEPRVPASVLA